ncbi:DEAD/DEAH box helicase [Chondromyces crocatus]|uniref:ATP-dependent helicase n=1 Tax=Chondromyces crocatus TaxID=52 RepID=A0A0K1EJ85_CHOCO|nr:DEAD/DEAH box helicase [Chondromyces crocatus]AKT40929.1 ATP-dependent helicase [Chondromyces crocatus]
MPAPPWKVETGVDAVIHRWLASGAVRPCFTADRELPPVEPHHAPFPDDLSPALRGALEARGIQQLYAHQAQAIAAARAGRHVVVATPTASGKSLCFHLPVLEAITRDPGASAIYLYPTKALSRDQEAGVHALIREAGLSIPAVVYDGDTPGDARRAARERSPIVMTNPDMLHAGILPHHAHWARTFQKLKYVILDELHTYRGVFGSNVAHVLARLQRIAAFHGSTPAFLCATATIGNPREHAARMLGVPEGDLEIVTESGAPRGERRFFLFNPPVVNEELGIRASTPKSAVRLAADLARARVPTIIFGQSRNSVEIMLKYLREEVGKEVGEDAIMAYRGGYLPETRRRVERGLRDGEILCVVATSALELGIDIGDLDAVICAGYPGSIAETWQRFGRAGRRGERSVAVLCASSAPVDQYLARNPELLLDSHAESARIDPGNTEILIQHLKCAAFELPFLMGERYAVLAPEDTTAALRFLVDHGVVHESGDRFHWATDAYPANHVSLRAIGWDNFVIIDKAHGRTIAELDWRSTPTMLHEQAIYQHDGEQYQVERLDYENHKAYVTRVVPDYFTQAMTNRKVAVLDESASASLGRAQAAWGEVSIVEKIVGYKKIKFYTHENAGYGDVRLPDIQKHTTSFWLTVPEALCEALGMGRPAAIEGLRGIARALETVSTIALMCDPRDIGQTLGDAEGAGQNGDRPPTGGHGPQPGYDPTLFLFDNAPGGIGLAERIYERREELLARARKLLTGCGCAAGCPLCVGAVEQTAGAVRKNATLGLIALILHQA